MPSTSNSMPTSLPDNETLHHGLTRVLYVGDTGSSSDFKVLDREFNEHSSTYPSEIVRCQMEDGRILQLHCKYSIRERVKGHRKGIIHESRVYKHILQNSECETPQYYGTYNDIQNGDTWLVLEHIDNAFRVSKCDDGLLHAARWLGRFHKENTKHIAANSVLEKYDTKYFLKWAQQSKSLNSISQKNLAWLDGLCDRYEELIKPMLSAEQTIIHGEFYPTNILMKGGGVYPIDWESAAIAAGEVDLAALTEGWTGSLVKQCISEYQKCRWPEGSPTRLQDTLLMARIYWHLRWLGDKPNWNRQHWRLTNLKQDCRLLGLI